jgi:H+-transporting ATPase
MAILCGGNLTIYLTRNRHYVLSKPLPKWKFFVATLCSQVTGTIISAYGLGTSEFVGIGWKYVGYSWIYIAVWFLICMLTKRAIFYFLGSGSDEEHPFVAATKSPINQ